MTRIDLLGEDEGTSGLYLVELKVSQATERQGFTELLGYANHFCTLFPLLNENQLNSIFITPMKGRIVRDAYTQELIVNRKNVLSLVPEDYNYKDNNGNQVSGVRLKVHYPDDTYFQYYENTLFSDSSFCTLVCSFPDLPDWIDSNEVNNSPNSYTKDAFSQITSHLAERLESKGYSAMVFGRQRWQEIYNGMGFEYNNSIIINAINPYKASQLDVTTYGLDRNRNIVEVDGGWTGISDNPVEHEESVIYACKEMGRINLLISHPFTSKYRAVITIF